MRRMNLTTKERASVDRAMKVWDRAHELWSLDTYDKALPLLRELVECGWTIYKEELEFTEDAQKSGFTLDQCRFLWSWLGRFKRDAVDEARE